MSEAADLPRDLIWGPESDPDPEWDPLQRVVFTQSLRLSRQPSMRLKRKWLTCRRTFAGEVSGIRAKLPPQAVFGWVGGLQVVSGAHRKCSVPEVMIKVPRLGVLSVGWLK